MEPKFTGERGTDFMVAGIFKIWRFLMMNSLHTAWYLSLIQNNVFQLIIFSRDSFRFQN
jgi:hypothetical protein